MPATMPGSKLMIPTAPTIKKEYIQKLMLITFHPTWEYALMQMPTDSRKLYETWFGLTVRSKRKITRLRKSVMIYGTKLCRVGLRIF